MRKVAEIVSRIAYISGDSKKASKEFLNAFVETIEEGLIRDGVVYVKGLGRFKTKMRGIHNSRNVKTGEKIIVPEKKFIYFRPDKEFKKNINEL